MFVTETCHRLLCNLATFGFCYTGDSVQLHNNLEASPSTKIWYFCHQHFPNVPPVSCCVPPDGSQDRRPAQHEQLLSSHRPLPLWLWRPETLARQWRYTFFMYALWVCKLFLLYCILATLPEVVTWGQVNYIFSFYSLSPKCVFLSLYVRFSSNHPCKVQTKLLSLLACCSFKERLLFCPN